VIAPETGFQKLLWTSLIVLVVVVGVINLVAVLMNIKVRK
jgi:ABC-type phosphate transport system permease subunit